MYERTETIAVTEEPQSSDSLESVNMSMTREGLGSPAKRIVPRSRRGHGQTLPQRFQQTLPVHHLIPCGTIGPIALLYCGSRFAILHIAHRFADCGEADAGCGLTSQKRAPERSIPLLRRNQAEVEPFPCSGRPVAGVAKLVDARDLKSLDRMVMRVRPPPSAPAYRRTAIRRSVDASSGARSDRKSGESYPDQLGVLQQYRPSQGTIRAHNHQKRLVAEILQS